VPNKLSPGAFSSTLRPWFLNPWLALSMFVAAALLLLAQLSVRRQKRLASDPNHVRAAAARRVVQSHLKIMEGAVSQGAAAEFFAAARGAFQTQLGLRWGLRPQTITLAEVNSRMNGEAEGFRFIFELADEVAYTGRSFTQPELRKWLATIQGELAKLEVV
jgi:hypothetical protein